jgi:phage protein D
MAVHPQFAPEYQVKVNGRDLPQSVRSAITAVRYDDGIRAADRVEIDVANLNVRLLQEHIRGLGFRPFPTGVRIGPVGVNAVPSGTFDIDNSLSLSMGYASGPVVEMFRGEVTGVELEFPEAGLPKLTLVAHDKLNRLKEGKYARGFGILPDFLIAAILGAENLLLPAIDPTVAAASTAMTVLGAIFGGSGTKQKGQSDFALLKEIADRFDADFWVEGDVLWLSRFIKEYEPRLTLTWGGSLLSFAPRMSKVGQVVGVGAKFTLREIPFDFLVSAAWDFDREALRILVVPGAAAAYAKTLIGPIVTLITRPIGSPADIANSAFMIIRKLRQKLNNRLTGSGVAVGDPRIRANAVIRIEGIGPDFSGNYRVAAARHVIDEDGYRTHFQVRKEIIP